MRGPLGELAARAAAGELTLRGEFAIVVEAMTAAGSASRAAAVAPSMAEARAEVARLVASGARRSEAVRRVAADTGLDRRELYHRP